MDLSCLSGPSAKGLCQTSFKRRQGTYPDAEVLEGRVPAQKARSALELVRSGVTCNLRMAEGRFTKQIQSGPRFQECPYYPGL